MTVVVYSKNNCPACVRVKNELTLKGVEFVEVNIDRVPAAKAFIIEKGHRSVPVVYVDDVHTDPATLTNEIV